jgi:hypothetical protein
MRLPAIAAAATAATATTTAATTAVAVVATAATTAVVTTAATAAVATTAAAAITAATAAAATTGVATTATAAEATTATAAAATTATTALLALLGFVHAKRAAVEGATVHALDRLCGFFGSSHGHERKAAGPAGFAVRDQVDITYGSEFLERSTDAISIGIERKISYIQTSVHRLLDLAQVTTVPPRRGPWCSKRGFKRKVRCCKLPLSTGPKPVNCGVSKLLLAVCDCHLESRWRSNCSERHRINARNSLRIAVSEPSDVVWS